MKRLWLIHIVTQGDDLLAFHLPIKKRVYTDETLD